MFYFNIGECREASGAPIDEALATIDQPVFMESHEDFEHGFGQAFVHRKSQAVPVAGFSELLLLLDDCITRCRLPLPDAFDEPVAPKCFPGKPLSHELLFDDVLSRNAGMVGTGEPERIPSLHAPPPDEDVLQRMVQCMADMEGSRHIRWGNHNAIRLAWLLRRRVEIAASKPLTRPACFDGFGVIRLFKLKCRHGCPVQGMRAAS